MLSHYLWVFFTGVLVIAIAWFALMGLFRALNILLVVGNQALERMTQSIFRAEEELDESTLDGLEEECADIPDLEEMMEFLKTNPLPEKE